jgi:CHASE3 domain sensor protein
MKKPAEFVVNFPMPFRKRSAGKCAFFGFIVAMIVLLASRWLASVNIRRILRSAALFIHTHEVLDEIRDTLAMRAIPESRQRSHLVTGEAVYLQPYRSAAGFFAHLAIAAAPELVIPSFS